MMDENRGVFGVRDRGKEIEDAAANPALADSGDWYKNDDLTEHWMSKRCVSWNKSGEHDFPRPADD